MSYEEQSMISASDIEEETIVFDYSSSMSSPLHESASQPLWLEEEEEDDETLKKPSDITSTPSTASPSSSSSSSSMSYYQNLALKLRSGGKRPIRILSDNPASHSSNGKALLPSLPPLYEYSAMDQFLPLLLKEKGIIGSSIVSDNPSSRIPNRDYSSELDEEVIMDVVIEQPCSSLSASSDASIMVDEAIQQMDRKVGRSSSYNAIYTTPKPQRKRSVTRARSFQGNRIIKGGDDLSNKSPQSIMDLFNPEDTAELRSSFHSL